MTDLPHNAESDPAETLHLVRYPQAFDCPACQHAITREQYMGVEADFTCPVCGTEFIIDPAVELVDGTPITTDHADTWRDRMRAKERARQRRAAEASPLVRSDLRVVSSQRSTGPGAA